MVRGLVDDQSSRPEVVHVQVLRVDTVSTRGISQAVLAGSKSGNNSLDHIVIDGIIRIIKQVPSR